MRSSVIRLILLLAVVLGVAAVVKTVEWKPAATVMPAPADRREGQSAQPAASLLDSVTLMATRAAVFRERRSLASVPFDPARPQGTAAPPPSGAPRPAPQLVGIAWGNTPVALLDGIPGTDGSRAMQRGDTAGGLKLRRIFPHEVTMTGYDTTWTLRIREFQ